MLDAGGRTIEKGSRVRITSPVHLQRGQTGRVDFLLLPGKTNAGDLVAVSLDRHTSIRGKLPAEIASAVISEGVFIAPSDLTVLDWIN